MCLLAMKTVDKQVTVYLGVHERLKGVTDQMHYGQAQPCLNREDLGRVVSDFKLELRPCDRFDFGGEKTLSHSCRSLRNSICFREKVRNARNFISPHSFLEMEKMEDQGSRRKELEQQSSGRESRRESKRKEIK